MICHFEILKQCLNCVFYKQKASSNFMKNIFSIFILTTISFCCLGQPNDSILFKISGKVIEDSFKLAVRNPTITITTSDGQIAEAKGDSIGNYTASIHLSKTCKEIHIKITASGYFGVKDKIFITENADSIVLKKDYGIQFGPSCSDSFLPGDILFAKNSLIPEKYYIGTADSLSIDSSLYYFVQGFKKHYDDFKIELVAYSGYDEDSSLCLKRLNLIYDELIAYGFPKRKLIKTAKYRQPREYYPYRDTCISYYMRLKQPYIIDEKYIASFTDQAEKEKAEQLRRVVTFNWVFKKK
jgi:hypothetical protein